MKYFNFTGKHIQSFPPDGIVGIRDGRVTVTSFVYQMPALMIGSIIVPDGYKAQFNAIYPELTAISIDDYLSEAKPVNLHLASIETATAVIIKGFKDYLNENSYPNHPGYRLGKLDIDPDELLQLCLNKSYRTLFYQKLEKTINRPI